MNIAYYIWVLSTVFIVNINFAAELPLSPNKIGNDAVQVLSIQQAKLHDGYTMHCVRGQYITTTNEGHITYDNESGELLQIDLNDNCTVINNFETLFPDKSFLFGAVSGDSILAVKELPNDYSSFYELGKNCNAYLYSIDNGYKTPFMRLNLEQNNPLIDSMNCFVAHNILVVCSHKYTSNQIKSFLVEEYSISENIPTPCLRQRIFDLDDHPLYIFNINNKLFFLLNDFSLQVITVGDEGTDYMVPSILQNNDGQKIQLNAMYFAGDQHVAFDVSSYCVEDNDQFRRYLCLNRLLYMYDIQNDSVSSGIDIKNNDRSSSKIPHDIWSHYHDGKLYMVEQSFDKEAYGQISNIKPAVIWIMNLNKGICQAKAGISNGTSAVRCNAYKNLLFVSDIADRQTGGITIWDLNDMQQLRYISAIPCDLYLEDRIKAVDGSLWLIDTTSSYKDTQVMQLFSWKNTTLQ